VPVVATGALSSPVPGIWRRLSLISSDESIKGLHAERLIGQLEELGIPRHQHDLVHLLLSWKRASIPPDVALALWLLREQEDGHGCIYRRAAIPVEESSPAIRYIQLAAEVGETMDTDPTLCRVVSWLLERQLPDGSIPLVVSTGSGQVGQTCRALRALGRLADPALEERLDAMDCFLRAMPIRQPVGHAWSYSKIDDTAVTGSTCLAALALLERDDEPGEVVTEGLRYLVASQDAEGGWAEVPGYRPTIQNTQHAVRTLRAARDAGLLKDELDPVLDRARQWFLRTVRQRPPKSTLELSFAIRIGVELDLLLDKRVEALGRQLAQRQRHTLSAEADMYAETELSAITLIECSRRLDGLPGEASSWAWRWRLPPLPPPFLARGTYLYELLYSLVKKRWWVRTVDALVNARIIDRVAALLLGVITALGVVDDHITDALRSSSGDFRADVTNAIVGVLLLLWLGVKTTARSSVLKAAYSSIGSLGVAALLTWIFYSPGMALSVVISLTGLRWLIVDVVAFAAESSGLLERLLPKNS
jgi:Prenyltransferase and squalene oxidase repeat